MSLSTTIASPIRSLPIEDQSLKLKKNVLSSPIGLRPFRVQFRPVECRSIKPLPMQFPPVGSRSITLAPRVQHSSVICAAALSATCAAEQTQTVTRQSSTITVAPIEGKEKSPELDDGGTGFPPRDDDDGGGGGGGGGGHWSGGFFFFGFLAFLGFLKDQESEGPYRDKRRRR